MESIKAPFLLPIILWAFCTLRSTVGIGVDVGTCPDGQKTCTCGNGYRGSITFEYNQCIHFYRWQPSCRICNNYLDLDAECNKYQHCLTCLANPRSCSSCHAGRYGVYCELDCQCQNGATCLQDGSCECADRYQGQFCERRRYATCSNPGAPTNGRLLQSNTEYIHNERLHIRCYSGYAIIGSSVRTCNDGVWSGSMPICAKECPHLSNPSNSVVEITHEPHSNYIRSVHYTCEDGFQLAGVDTVTCQRNGHWNAGQPTCLQLCRPFEVPDHGRLLNPLIHDAVEGDSIQFVCQIRHQMIGDAIRVCQEDGRWSGNQPQCVRTCEQISAPSHGNMELTAFMVGNVAVFFCDDGYRLDGDEQLTCMPNGEWSSQKPSCTAVCDIPEIPAKVVYEMDIVGAIEGSTIIFSCLSGFFLVGNERTVCMEDRSWSAQTPQCIPVSGCDEPGVPPFARIYDRRSDGQESFAVGDSVVYVCRSGYRMIGYNTRVCQGNSEWSVDAPTCVDETECEDPGIPLNMQRQTLPPPEGGNGRTILSRVWLPAGKAIDSYSSSQNENSNADSFGDYSLDYEQPEDSSGSQNETISQTEMFAQNTKLLYSCNSRIYRIQGSEQRTCVGGKWSGHLPTCVPVCGKTSGDKNPFILNGNDTIPGQWPWQVALFKTVSRRGADRAEPYLICGGTILNERWLVTAAHCVAQRMSSTVDRLDLFSFKVGKFYRNDSWDDEFVQTYLPSHIVVHPNFDPQSLNFDMALVQTSIPMTLSDRVRPVCLPARSTSRQNLRPGSEGVVTGWGRNEFHEMSDDLKQATIPVVNTRECERNYRIIFDDPRVVITRNMFCAGFPEGQIDSCNGDSGGPLVFPQGTGSKRKWVLEGLVSWGSTLGCGLRDQYGVYTKVVRFIDWMKEYI